MKKKNIKKMSMSFSTDNWKEIKVITKTPLVVTYDEEIVNYHEGCAFGGYYEKGDSFIFSQGDLKKGEQRTLLCISRGFLTQLLEKHPKITK